MFFAHQLLQRNKSFRIFSEAKKSASQVSAGIINPVVLKKFTTFWKAQEQIGDLQFVLSEIALYTGKNYFINEKVHRIFHDENEKSIWLKKALHEDLKAFLNCIFRSFDDITNPYQSGEVIQSGRLNVSDFFRDLHRYHENAGNLIRDRFDYSQMNPTESTYKKYHYSKIVFCEGMSVINNPFFSEIPVQANKGHHIKVCLSKPLDEHFTFKKKHFFFQLKDDLYFYGGTYDRDAADPNVDEAAVLQLLNGLKEIYPHSFEIVDVKVGFRPTVKDRRPIIGRHSKFLNLAVFNGLGARGILNGCYFSKILYNHLENGLDLPSEVSLERFKH